jgi:hypothetical protein
MEVPGHSLGLEAGPDDIGFARHRRPPDKVSPQQSSEASSVKCGRS